MLANKTKTVKPNRFALKFYARERKEGSVGLAPRGSDGFAGETAGCNRRFLRHIPKRAGLGSVAPVSGMPIPEAPGALKVEDGGHSALFNPHAPPARRGPHEAVATHIQPEAPRRCRSLGRDGVARDRPIGLRIAGLQLSIS